MYQNQTYEVEVNAEIKFKRELKNYIKCVINIYN